MGKLDSITFAGLEMWFWSGDHDPPHFHAKKPGEWEIRVYFLEVTHNALAYEVIWGQGPSGRTRAQLAKLVAPTQEALLAEWETKTQTETT